MKQWWKSKTVWANALAIGAVVAQGQAGVEITPEAQVSLLALVNLVLRALTKEPLGW